MENAKEFVTERELFELLKEEIRESRNNEEYHSKLVDKLNATLQKKMEDNKIITIENSKIQANIEMHIDDNQKDYWLKKNQNSGYGNIMRGV
jgi:hypothetical protein